MSARPSPRRRSSAESACSGPTRCRAWASRSASSPIRRATSSASFSPREEPKMGDIVVSQFVSLDGVIEDPGGAEDFEYGGWAFKFNRGDDGDKFKLDEVMSADALLLGRKTYEGFADAWPSREGEFADKFNNMPSTSCRPPWASPTGTTRWSFATTSRARWRRSRSSTRATSS